MCGWSLRAFRGEGISQIDRALRAVGVETILNPGGSHLAMIEEPANRLFQATGIPFPSRPADNRSNQ
jgi:hypothetical protein